jgi:predicted nucleotidyltransferase
MEARVERFVHVSHASGADETSDFVRSELSARSERARGGDYKVGSARRLCSARMSPVAAPFPGIPDEAFLRTAEETTGLRLLLLFGSRARDESHHRSDWDFGYLATPDMDRETLQGRLAEVLRTDRIDMVDLERASGLLRYRAARDGRLV